MDLTYSAEQEDFRQGVRSFLAARCRPEDVRVAIASPDGFDRELWHAMAEQLDLPGLIVPEAWGGGGFGQRELTLVFEEMGRVLLPGPYFASVALATNLLLASGDDDAKGEYLPAMARGEAIATVALLEDGPGVYTPGSVAATAELTQAGWRLDGCKRFVLSAGAADLLLVVARTDAGISLFAVAANATGVRIDDTPALDLTRPLATVTLDGAPGRLIGTDGDAGPAVAEMLDHAVIALAAEQAGGAQVALDMAVGYAADRIQFGRPIGSFQAIKHKLADVMTAVEQARASAYYAGWAVDDESDDVALAASLAAVACSEGYFAAASANIQIHGAIAITWEHAAHLYFKRAKSSQVLLGTPDRHRARIADLLELDQSALARASN